MDGPRFDDVVRELSRGRGSRRPLFGLLSASVLALLGGRAAGSDVAAHDALKKCKKLKGKKKQKCVKKARRHNASHEEPTPELCDGVACPDGQRCCPDARCGQECCDNGRACNVVCTGPTGNDYCCHESRPVAVCGGCWQIGSIQCETPGHCCGPNQVCCGDDHCCDKDTQECRVNCAGVVGSNSCCIKGAGPTCCPDGVPG